MPPPRIVVVMIREEYDAFVRLTPNDPYYLGSYDDWIKRTTEQKAQYLARGEVIKEVIIHAEEFAAYCRSRGLKISGTSLEALAAEKAFGKS